jgi:hypothetical protein
VNHAQTQLVSPRGSKWTPEKFAEHIAILDSREQAKG